MIENLNTIIETILRASEDIRKAEVIQRQAREDLAKYCADGEIFIVQMEKYCADGVNQLVGHYTEHLELGYIPDTRRYFLENRELHTEAGRSGPTPDTPFLDFKSYNNNILIETARTIEEALKSLTPSK